MPATRSIFHEELRALALAEARQPLPRDPLLFYGSSSIRLWDSLAADFEGVAVVNHGFGGSTLAECLDEMERLVFPVEPRGIVLYAGDNDLDQGASPEMVRDRFVEFVTRVDDQLGLVPVVFISIKPSPARFWNFAKIRDANELIRATIEHWPLARFLDLSPLMLQPGGSAPRAELYTADGLHMNAAGYALWSAQVRATLGGMGLLS